MLNNQVILNKDADKLENTDGRRPFFWLGLVLFISGALRIYDLGKESYWVDEIYTMHEGLQSIHQLLTSGRLDQPPGFYLPFNLWLQIFGTAEANSRSFSVLAGLGSIVLIYLIGRQLFGMDVGVLSALLMGVSSFQLFYSQEARFYAFFEFTVLLSFLFLILALKDRKTIFFILYGLASILMLYSHTYGIFILAAQNLFFLLQIKRYQKMIGTWILLQVVLCLAFLPYAVPLILGGSNLTQSVDYQFAKTYPVPSIPDLFRTLYRFIIADRDTTRFSWEIVLTIDVIAVFCLVTGTGFYIWKTGKSNWLNAVKSWNVDLRRTSNITNEVVLTGSWLLVPILVPFLISLAIIPIYLDKYMIGASPAFYLLLALVIYSFRKVTPLLIILGVLAVIIVPGLTRYYSLPNHEQWREAAAFVYDNTKEGEIIIHAGGTGDGIEQKAFEWYYKGTLPSCVIRNDFKNSDAKLSALLNCVSGYGRFWVILRNNTEPSNIEETYKYFFSNSQQTTLRLLNSQQFLDITVYHFELVK